MEGAKIIYLDFDGVLHPSTPGENALFSKAYLLEPIVENSNASIVISSSWRFTHTLENLKAKLPSFLASRVIDTTGHPIIGKHARYQEVSSHAYKNNFSRWRALDDSYWEFPSNCKELIRCNPNSGISTKEIMQLATWLAD